MTERLYYDDAYGCEFEATVLDVRQRDGLTAVWLDRTAFYPTSGGQPFDVGTLASARVVGVDDERGSVVHVLEGPAPAVGSLVRGVVDWSRRFDHMQQHTGQHVLSAAIERTAGGRSVSFHLGAESSTIDVDRELTAAEIATAELAANRIVWDDRLVAIRYATDDEARALPLRKESARMGTLRLVEVESVDLSACGGTHVARTGAIGQIAVVAWERFKGGQRLEFLCGERALARFRQLREASAASVRLLSVLPGELPSAVERLQAELKEQKRSLMLAQAELAKYEALTLLESAQRLSGARVVAAVVDGDAARLKALASAIAEQPDAVALLVARSTPVLVAVARAPQVAVSCQEIVAALTKEFGGRGGGKPDLAQCGGLQALPAAVLSFARALIS